MDTIKTIHARTDLTLAIAIALGQNSFGYRITNDTERANFGHVTVNTAFERKHGSIIENLNNATDSSQNSMSMLGSNGLKFNDTGQNRWSTITVHLSAGLTSLENSSNSLLISPTSFAQHVDINNNASAIGQLSVSAIDVIIVSFILVTWFIVIGVFIHKWQHLRIVEPREYRFQHKPKNLDSIKIVKRQSDSVIYRAYPVAMTKTMAAREKRLERMHTMPAIKVDLESKSPAIKLKEELESHIPILCLHSMDDLGENSEEDVTEKQFMLKPVQV